MFTASNALKWGNLALAFFLELWMLFAFGFWGFHTGSGLFAKVTLGIGAPLLAAVAWGLLLAPKAPVRLPAPAHLILTLAFFGVAALALVAAGQPLQALIFAALVALNQALRYVLHQ